MDSSPLAADFIFNFAFIIFNCFSAERKGFEPLVPGGHNGFRYRPIKPLSHLS